MIFGKFNCSQEFGSVSMEVLVVWYLVAFFAALLVDSIPVFAPPAWTILVILLIRFHLNPWLLIFLGVIGSAIGRFILTLYVPWLGRWALSRSEDKNLEFLGQHISKSGFSTFLFVVLYSVTPLSTTALFTAAALAKVRKLFILPPFMIGKFISDAAMILSGQYAADNFEDLLKEGLTPKAVLLGSASLLVILAFLFIDWRQLLQNKKIRFHFQIWK